MTLSDNIKVKCPRCSSPVSGNCFSSINVDINPELKSKILNHDINKFSCSSCNRIFYIPTPLVYNDPQNNLMIGCLPEDEIKIWPEYEIDEIATNRELKARLGHLYGEKGIHTSRIVFGYDYLIEKIKIFDWLLDDLAIAIHKLYLIQDDERASPPDIYLNSYDANSQTIQYFFSSTLESYEINSPTDLYLEILKNFEKDGTTTRDFVFVDYKRFVGPYAEDQESIINQKIKYRAMRKRKRDK